MILRHTQSLVPYLSEIVHIIDQSVHHVNLRYSLQYLVDRPDIGQIINQSSRSGPILFIGIEAHDPFIVQWCARIPLCEFSLVYKGETIFHIMAKDYFIQDDTMSEDKDICDIIKTTCSLFMFRRDGDGDSPFHVAIRYQNTIMMEYFLSRAMQLIEQGVDRVEVVNTVFAPDQNGDTPLLIATKNRMLDMVNELVLFMDQLLVQGLDRMDAMDILSVRDQDGLTALEYAVQDGDVDIIVANVLSINGNVRDLQGNTLLFQIIMMADDHAIWLMNQLLPKHEAFGFDLNDTNAEGNTILHIAAFRGLRMIVNMLLAMPSVKIAMPNHNLLTPEFIAQTAVIRTEIHAEIRRRIDAGLMGRRTKRTRARTTRRSKKRN